MTPDKQAAFDNSVREVMHTLPPVIREYLEKNGPTMVARNLISKYGLHLDQGNILEREIMLLLMGIENPDEFTQALAEEGKMETQSINGIIQDVNNQIFIPLRNEMQRSAAAPPAGVPQVAKPPQQSVAPPAASTTPQPSKIFNIPKQSEPYMPEMPRGTFAPPLQSPRYPNQDNISSYVRTVSFQKPQPINRIQRPAKSEQPIMPSRPPVQNAAAPVPAPKPLDTDRRLEDHEEPHIELNKPPMPPSPSAARTSLPPPNLPGAFAMPSMPDAPRVPAAPEPAPSKPSVQPPSPPVSPPRPYSSDPYREPIEGEDVS